MLTDIAQFTGEADLFIGNWTWTVLAELVANYRMSVLFAATLQKRGLVVSSGIIWSHIAERRSTAIVLITGKSSLKNQNKSKNLVSNSCAFDEAEATLKTLVHTLHEHQSTFPVLVLLLVAKVSIQFLQLFLEFLSHCIYLVPVKWIEHAIATFRV